MRIFSSESLAKLQEFGSDPYLLIEVQWVDGGAWVPYSDKGPILELSGLESVVQISQGNQSAEISIKLDDTDGSLKQIIDTTDIHKRPVRVYQMFEGITDRAFLFQGLINTPLSWDEGDRTLSFDVLSKIEDVEIGFSLEEGISNELDEDLVGRSWPLCFGTVNNVPCLALRTPVQGTLATGTGIHDFTLPKRIKAAKKLCCPETIYMGQELYTPNIATNGTNLGVRDVYARDPNCIQQNCVTVKTLELSLVEQRGYEISPITIFGGEKFPQGTPLTIDISGGRFTGSFTGNIFNITGRIHPDFDNGQVRKTEKEQNILALCGKPDPEVYGDQCEKNAATLNAIDAANFFWANAGSRVVVDSSQEIVYVANLIPSTVLRVSAYRSLNGARQLVTVPSDYYTIRYTDYTGYVAVTELVFNRPLSTRDQDLGGGWEDDIYVTLMSDVGPNTVDIIKWTLDTYAPGYDQDGSFDVIRPLLENYPMHFFVPGRKNLISFLQEVAEQARCAIWLKDNTFYLRYLSLEPEADDTISEDDVLANTLRIEHTPTEDLVTKYVSSWQWDYAQEKKNKLILRHNVKKYGMHEKEYDYYCYTIQDLVHKSATFWLIRKANTWRRVTFRTHVHKLCLEPFDTVELNLPDISSVPVKGIVEKATYDSDSREIEFSVWTPLKSGTTTPYLFAWPADVEESDLFPTIEERELGLAGSGTQPNFSTVAPPGHVLSQSPQQGGGGGGGSPCTAHGTLDLLKGQQNCHKDQGKKKPTDKGDTKPEPRGMPDTGPPATTQPPITVDVKAELEKQKKSADEANRKADAAKSQAAEARELAGGGGADGTKPGDKEKQQEALEKKPRPDVDEAGNCVRKPGDCVAFVQVNTASVVSVRDVATGAHKAEGSGYVVNYTQGAGPCIGFNSLEMARAYRASLPGGNGEEYVSSVGSTIDWGPISTVSGDLGLGPTNEEGFVVPCEDPGEKKGQITSYRPAGPPADPPPTEES